MIRISETATGQRCAWFEPWPPGKTGQSCSIRSFVGPVEMRRTVSAILRGWREFLTCAALCYDARCRFGEAGAQSGGRMMATRTDPKPDEQGHMGSRMTDETPRAHKLRAAAMQSRPRGAGRPHDPRPWCRFRAFASQGPKHCRHGERPSLRGCTRSIRDCVYAGIPVSALFLDPDQGSISQWTSKLKNVTVTKPV